MLAKSDNQRKLASAECDERHLYVFIEDGSTGVVLNGLWPLPLCSVDPLGVIDALWIFSPVSAHLFRVSPGGAGWSVFNAATEQIVS